MQHSNTGHRSGSAPAETSRATVTEAVVEPCVQGHHGEPTISGACLVMQLSPSLFGVEELVGVVKDPWS